MMICLTGMIMFHLMMTLWLMMVKLLLSVRDCPLAGGVWGTGLTPAPHRWPGSTMPPPHRWTITVTWSPASRWSPWSVIVLPAWISFIYPGHMNTKIDMRRSHQISSQVDCWKQDVADTNIMPSNHLNICTRLTHTHQRNLRVWVQLSWISHWEDNKYLVEFMKCRLVGAWQSSAGHTWLMWVKP